jgi:endogenous inhibitor of DNA gyrase (YacG/DUF329 family)
MANDTTGNRSTLACNSSKQCDLIDIVEWVATHNRSIRDIRIDLKALEERAAVVVVDVDVVVVRLR